MRRERSSARSFVALIAVIFLASGPSRSISRVKTSMSMSGEARTTAPIGHGRLAAGGAQHAQGLERQERPHAMSHDVDAAAARRLREGREQLLEPVARP